ncbi:MAG: MerR family transcriptional regulator [Omnitrophica WOR_2 bacterium]
MPKKKAEYAIKELARQANVSVRTVRFYINEGLLPTPKTRGRYTVYTEEYLDRLELIRRLKESYLPLKEIRATLAALSSDEVRATLDDLRRREASSEPSIATKEKSEPGHKIGEARSSALEYIADLVSSKPVSRPLPPRTPSQSMQAAPAKASEPLSESWQRVSLGPGVEMHIRQPVRPEDQPKVDAVIQLAHRLFSP